MHTITRSSRLDGLVNLIAKLSEYVHDSEDIPSWDVEEIDSQLDDLLVEAAKLAPNHDAQERDILDLARQQWRQNDIDIDADAVISDGDDNGAYVQAWLWVDFSGTPLDKEAHA